MPKKLNIDKDLLIFLYIDCRLSACEISSMLRCSSTSIFEYLENYSIPRRGLIESHLGNHHSEETKQKISESHKGEKNHFYGKRHTEETKQKLKLRIGEKSPNFGKHFTDDHKHKISVSNTGWKHTEESKKKMSEIHKGQIVTEETRKKISIAHSGKNNPSYGKPAHPKSGCGKGEYYILSNGDKFWTRSTYERRVINCLVYSGIEFKYEYTRFILNNTTYSPDIYIPKYDIYIEIKGYLSPKYIKKYHEFVELYPKIDILIIFDSDITKLEEIIESNDRINWKTIGKKMSEVV